MLRQSERADIHLDVVRSSSTRAGLRRSRTPEEVVEARHRAAGPHPKLGYDNFDRRDLTDEQRTAYRDEAVRLYRRLHARSRHRVGRPGRGTTTIKALSRTAHRATRPLYTLVNPAGTP